MSNTIDKGRLAVEDEDIEYVRACQKGDADAFETLVERHQKKMLNIAYRMLGDYDDACDVTQEAFIAAYKAIKKFKGEAKFSTWLYRIVINYAKNHLKKRKSIETREGISIDDSEKIKEKGVLFSSETIGANPGTQMEKREREEQVQKCISTLDEEFKEVLVLRDIQGFSYEEICAILKIPDGTVKSRLSRARGVLKDCLVKVIGDL
jgi:RNA polymerase sigma-70 factor (ECF subfamily)